MHRLADAPTLVTGALGCLGAWTVKALVDDGLPVVTYDLGGSDHRLRLALPDEGAAGVTRVEGDVTDLAALERVLNEHDVGAVIHLAALQVPFVRDDPPLGTAVNVVGTVNVLEAAARRRDRVPHVVYASSTAVYSAADPSPAPESGGREPATHYGVTKLANEGMARVYFEERGLPSLGLRPYVVYGPGRDQGMTSTPTQAMAAAARGEAFHISYGGRCQYDYAPDVGRALVAAARARVDGAVVANFPGVPASMDDVVAAIEAAAPEVAGRITYDDVQLPFPPEMEARALERAVGRVPRTPLADGVRETIELYRGAASGQS
jgi:nucleoside-diphosphate-sugar epimerase